MSRIGAFLSEIRHRRIWFVGGGYLIAAWVILQVATTLEGTLELPNWVDVTVLSVLAVGFPMALIIGFVQDRRAPEVEEEVSVEGAVPDPKGIAVLPFENLSPDPDNAWFAAGIHEEVLNQLAKVNDLNVIARTSVTQYLGTEKTIPVIAAELSVGKVMEGSVRYAGNRVRVTAQLIDGVTSNHIWSDTFDRDLDDIFAIQTDVALAITAQMKATLTEAEADAIRKPPTNNAEAYRIYLQAEAGPGQANRRSFEKLVGELDKAIDLDPGFALAIARKAVAISNASDVFNIALVDEPFDEALRLAEEAIRLDPLLAAGHMAKGFVARALNDWPAALKALETAVELAPSGDATNRALALLLNGMGRFAEALPVLQKAMAADPLDQTLHNTASNLYRKLGRLEDALQEGRMAIACGKDNPFMYIQLANMLSLAGREHEAVPLIESAERLIGNDDGPLKFWAAMTWGLAGQPEKTRAMVETMDLETQSVQARAGYLVAIGDKDAALTLLEESFEREGRLPGPVSTMLALEPIHSEPRFQALMERRGSPT